MGGAGASVSGTCSSFRGHPVEEDVDEPVGAVEAARTSSAEGPERRGFRRSSRRRHRGRHQGAAALAAPLPSAVAAGAAGWARRAARRGGQCPVASAEAAVIARTRATARGSSSCSTRARSQARRSATTSPVSAGGSASMLEVAGDDGLGDDGGLGGPPLVDRLLADPGAGGDGLDRQLVVRSPRSAALGWLSRIAWCSEGVPGVARGWGFDNCGHDNYCTRRPVIRSRPRARCP